MQQNQKWSNPDISPKLLYVNIRIGGISTLRSEMKMCTVICTVCAYRYCVIIITFSLSVDCYTVHNSIHHSFSLKQITLLSQRFFVFLLRHFEPTVLAGPVFQSALFGP
jgi:hypothetical protein